MSLVPLGPEQVRQALAALPGWTHADEALNRTWRFADFRTAMAFLADCMPDIEQLDHHPEWHNVYDRVSARLTTHDAGNRVTALDVQLAKIMEWRAGTLGVRG
jgi:4a-hydroxytetrahydrobiopterin dehydratase